MSIILSCCNCRSRWQCCSWGLLQEPLALHSNLVLHRNLHCRSAERPGATAPARPAPLGLAGSGPG
jgi:hypothetical protein